MSSMLRSLSLARRWRGLGCLISAAICAGLLLALCPQSRASVVTYSYDSSGRLYQATYDNGIVVTYLYDANGNSVPRTI